jgi:hypothetical protein
MIVYCGKTGQVYNIDLKFQQPLRDAWANIVQQIQTTYTRLPNDNRSRTLEIK